MLLNMFFIYLVAFATAAAGFSNKRIGRRAADNKGLTSDVEMANANTLQHYAVHNGREKQYTDTGGGLKCHSKRRIRRRGPPSLQHRHRNHESAKVEKIHSRPNEGCLVTDELTEHSSRMNKRQGRPKSITAREPLTIVERQEIGVTDQPLPVTPRKEMLVVPLSVVQGNRQHAIKHRSPGHERKAALSVEEVTGNKMQSEPIRGAKEDSKALEDQNVGEEENDDYGEVQDDKEVEMTEKSMKLSAREAKPKEVDVEKRHKRKIRQNSASDTGVGMQNENGKLEYKKQAPLDENEVEKDSLSSEKEKKVGNNKNLEENESLSSNEVAKLTMEDNVSELSGSVNDAEKVKDEQNEKDDTESEETEEEKEEDTVDDQLHQNSKSALASENDSNEERDEESVEENMQKTQQSGNSLGVDKSNEKEEVGKETEEQILTHGTDNKHALTKFETADGSAEERHVGKQMSKREEKKIIVKSQDEPEQASADVYEQKERLLSSGEREGSKRSLEGRSTEEEGGERDEEETLNLENANDEQEQSGEVSSLIEKEASEDKSDQEQAFAEKEGENNLEVQVSVNEQEGVQKEYNIKPDELEEIQGKTLQGERESQQLLTDKQDAEKHDLTASENEQIKSVEEKPEKEASRQADNQLDPLSNDDLSASEDDVTANRAESAEEDGEQSEQAVADDPGESETSSLETRGEKQELQYEENEEEMSEGEEGDEALLENKGSLHNEKITELENVKDKALALHQMSEGGDDQPQTGTRAHRELSKTETAQQFEIKESNETPLQDTDKKKQALEEDGNSKENAEILENEDKEEQTGAIAEDKETEDTSSAEMDDELERADREVNHEDHSKTENKNPESLANENDQETDAGSLEDEAGANENDQEPLNMENELCDEENQQLDVGEQESEPEREEANENF